MKHQQPMVTIALLLATSITVLSNPSFEEKQRNRLQMVRTEAARQRHLTPLDRAYLDAFSLLERGNTCAEFFGGAASIQVLDKLAVTLQNGLINDPRIGLMMSGRFTSFFNLQTGISYRLFANAEINSGGPFYKSKVRPKDPFIPNVGSFRPNTRAARALMLLHELAHLIRGRDGVWLIPDDGGKPELSHRNTMIVESRCGEEIRAL
jgi:hypothetical protein